MSEIKCFTHALESFIEADRLPIIDAVCDAIEGLCDEGCVWARGQYEDDYTHKASCNKYIYRASGGIDSINVLIATAASSNASAF
jgi:hypothetical protein